MADGQVIDPARGTASFHDDQIDFLAILEDCREIASIGSRGEEFSLASFGIEKAAHRIELAEVVSAKSSCSKCPRGLGWNECDSGCLRNPRSRSESPDFYFEWLPPKPRTYMDSFAVLIVSKLKLRMSVCQNLQSIC